MRALALAALLLSACAVDATVHPHACAPDGTCPAGRRCHRPEELPEGLCVVDETTCVAETEICNGVDDDCDERVDETFDLTSADRCGDCDTSCSPPNAMCVPDGAGGFDCGSECDRGRFTDCGADLCVDTSTDERHCGACGVTCDPGEDCVAGRCACGGVGDDCDGNTASTCCGTRCVDLNTDSANCGACNASCGTSGGSPLACVDQVCGCGDCRAPRSCLDLILMRCVR